VSNTYLNWEDLLEGDDQTNGSSQADTIPPKSRPLAELLDMDNVPGEIKALVEHGLGLERKVKNLVSGDDDDPDADRKRICYAVPVHTKETRIEERRQKREEELAVIRARRAQEKQRLVRKKERIRQEKRIDELERLRLLKVIAKQKAIDLQNRQQDIERKKHADRKMHERVTQAKMELLEEMKRERLIEQKWLQNKNEQREQITKDVLCQKNIEQRRLTKEMNARDGLRKQRSMQKIQERRREVEKWERQRDSRYHDS
jgi:hypothetical protein